VDELTRIMKEDHHIPKLSLFGGPLQRLGCRLRLVREGANTVWLGVVLGLLTWGVLVVLTLLQGGGEKVFSLSVIGVHVRLLVAIPLFFLCETWVGPRMAQFVHYIVRSSLVPQSEMPALESAIRRVNRMSDPWVAEIILALVVFVFPLVETFITLPGKTGSSTLLLAEAGGRMGPVVGWYLWFCLPLFRFLMLRWIWHLGLWWYFLWRVERLKLHLVPTHSDGAAGLGYLEVVQEHFTPLALAISAVVSAQSAEGIVSGTMAFEALYGIVLIVLLLVAVLFISPLLTFSRKLWRCRVVGLSEYMDMASHYVNAFDSRWIRDEQASGESQLGTPDLQSLADLTNSLNVVREMRCVPVGQRLLKGLAAAVILPLLPLLLLKYPIDQLSVRIFQMLTGQ